jgi:ankyrin repeat protein
MNVEMENGSVSATDQPLSDSIRSTASLLSLGNDVILLIADYLESERSINALVRTNRRLYLFLNGYLYRYNVVNARSTEWSALHWAARHGQERSVAESIAQGGELESKEVKYGRTPLCQAAENGHKAVVKVLLKAGADFEAEDVFGRTPLFKAAGHGHEAIINVLLEAGAKFKLKDHFGWTPLDSAVESGHEAVVKLLLLLNPGIFLEPSTSYGHGPGPRRGLLIRSIVFRHHGIVKLLIEAGAELEYKDSDGRTPLSHAAGIENAPLATVKLLVEAGAELETKDNHGRTPLSMAKGSLRGKNGEVIKFLLSVGAVNLDGNGQQSLQVRLKEAGSTLRNTVLGRR